MRRNERFGLNKAEIKNGVSKKLYNFAVKHHAATPSLLTRHENTYGSLSRKDRKTATKATYEQLLYKIKTLWQHKPLGQKKDTKKK